MRTLFTLCLCLLALPLWASIAVFDLSNLLQAKKQLMELRSQVTQLKKQYESMIGQRGFGQIHHDPRLRQALPNDFSRIYDSVSQEPEWSRRVQALQTHENSRSHTLASIRDRTLHKPLMDKALTLRAYDSTEQRLNQIERLMQSIQTTKDSKGIAELQARLAVEQAFIQTESHKLALFNLLQQSESALIEQERDALSHQILDSRNTGMPRLRG